MTARTPLSALLAASALALAACGGSDDAPSTPAGEAQPTAEASAPERDEQPAQEQTGAPSSASDAEEPARDSSEKERRADERATNDGRASSGDERRTRTRPAAKSEPKKKNEKKMKKRPTKNTRTAGWHYDKAEVSLAARTIRQYIKALDASDGVVCTRDLTLRFVERMTGREGDAAIERCREQIEGSKLSARLQKFGGGQVKDGEALIQYTASVGNTSRTTVAHMIKSGGRYRIDGDGTKLVEKIS